MWYLLMVVCVGLECSEPKVVDAFSTAAECIARQDQMAPDLKKGEGLMCTRFYYRSN